MFYNCKSLLSLPDISKWNLHNVSDMSYMFYNCKSLSSLPDISKWDTQNIEDMSYMFNNCYLFISFPNIIKWITKNDVDTSCVFDNFLSIQIFQDKNKLNYEESLSKGKKEYDQKIQNNNGKEKLQNNIIFEELYIELGETNTDINLFRTENNFQIDIYSCDKKINIFKRNNKWKYNFELIYQNLILLMLVI